MQHEHQGMSKGLRVITQGPSIQQDYLNREIKPNDPNKPQKCQELGRAGNWTDKEQRPIHNYGKVAKAKAPTKKQQDDLKSALDKDIKKRKRKT